MLHVWARSRWFIGNYTMRVFKWFPTFIPSNGEPSSAAIWVSLPSLPVAFFQEKLLYPIASLAGKVFAMDAPTRNLSRTNVARVCVEIELLKEHPRQVWVGVGEGGFWQDICYERLPSYCTDCREQGHSTQGCQANGSDSRSTAKKSKPKMKNLNYSRASGKQVRICPIIEDDAGGRHSMRLGSSQSSLWKDKDKEIDESLSVYSSRGYSSEDTDNKPKEATAQRGECSYTPTIEQNLSAEDSNGMANLEIDASGKSGFSETAAESVVSDTEAPKAEFGCHSEENRESVWQIVQKSLPIRPKGLNFLWRSKQKDFMPQASRPSHLEKFKYSEIKKMTNSFRDRVGKEGFSSVFKGQLPDGQKVAVRVTHAEQAFLKEIQVLNNTSHVNIIRLLGFCWEGTNRILVYEFMPNSSLAETTKESCSTNAKRSKQYCKIAIGIARGLNHLHHEFDPPILHLHINPSAILLDKDFCPKLTGLGLAHISSDSDPKVSGTVGYNPPEFYQQWKVSREADVYSYGITVLEMVLETGGKNPHWVRRRVIEEGGIESFAREETQRKMVIVGMWCTQHDPARRPSFSRVIDMLEGSVDDLSLPPSWSSSTVEDMETAN
ncbi:uncharacterized protein [Aristolochia californica]|uniref:uncharacterized protein n=1 Tax=Aristolochia californica TaxID=171875 RepID=UPI0035D54A01